LAGIRTLVRLAHLVMAETSYPLCHSPPMSFE
jgi:hypothetical protein